MTPETQAIMDSLFPAGFPGRPPQARQPRELTPLLIQLMRNTPTAELRREWRGHEQAQRMIDFERGK